jgi:hypothetical protein
MTETPLPESPSFTLDDVQRQIDAALAQQRQQNQEQLQQLRDEHAAQVDSLIASINAGPPIAAVPEHAGGPGTQIAATWSLAEQTAAREAAEAAR